MKQHISQKVIRRIIISNMVKKRNSIAPVIGEDTSLKNAPEFNFSFFEVYLDKLIEKEYLLSKTRQHEKATSVFKFYSNENFQIFKEGKLVYSLEGMSDEPYYWTVPWKED